MIFMLCGPLRFAMSARKQAERQAFKRYLVPRFTSVRVGEEVEPGPGQYARLLEQVSGHEGRNCLIADDVCAALDNGRTPLVLTRLKAHAQLLVDLLRERGRKAILLVGSYAPADKLARLEEVRRLKAEDSCALVATGSYLGEGFDLPRLDALFLGAPVSWEGLLAQYTGRLHRDAEGRKDVLVYDYIDANVPLFDKMYRKRLKGYAGLGYAVSPEYAAGGTAPCIVEGDAVFEGLLADVGSCGRSLVLGVSGWTAKRAEALARELQKATAARSVAATVYVGVSERRRGSMAATAASLEQAGCEVRWVEGGLRGLCRARREARVVCERPAAGSASRGRVRHAHPQRRGGPRVGGAGREVGGRGVRGEAAAVRAVLSDFLIPRPAATVAGTAAYRRLPNAIAPPGALSYRWRAIRRAPRS